MAISTIDRLLERIGADATVGVEEAFARVTEIAIFLDRPLDCVDDAILAEARADDLAEARILRARSAEQQLEILGALTVDPKHADMAGMMVAACVDAARNLELQFADIELARG